MKVLLLTETTKPTSGWGRIAFELIKRCQERGIEVMILTEDDSGTYKNILKNSLASLKSSLINSWKVRRYVKRCDIVHALDVYPYGLIGALATFGLSKPLVMTAIGTYAIMPLEHKRLRPFVVWACRRAKSILPIVNYTTEEMKKRMSGLPRLRRILLGVDIDRFAFNEKEEEEKSDRPFFLSVGALKKRRGNHFVLPAIAVLKKEFPNVQYRMIGSQADTEYVSFLKSETARWGIKDNVVFLGSVPEDDLLKMYRSCLAFVGVPDNTATNFAGFHLVYLEANAMGKPVIASKGYGTEETIVEGENGFLVDPSDPSSIARAMRKIISDSELRRRMRKLCRAHAAALTWDKTAEQYIEEYKFVLDI